MGKDNITIVYYKCGCECRVGVPEDATHKHGYIFGSKEFELFYCNNCKKITPHIYCGYRTVQARH